MHQQTEQAIKTGEWALLESHWPGCAAITWGVLLQDTSQDRLYVKVRPQWWRLSDHEEAALWCDFGEELKQQAEEQGAAQVLDWLENTASHAIRMSKRQAISFTSAAATLEELYQQHLESDPSRPPAPQPVTNSWKRKAAVAFTLLFTALGAGSHFPRRPASMPPTLLTPAAEPSSIPFATDAHIRLITLDLTMQAPLRKAVWRRRAPSRPAGAHRRRQLRLDPVVVRPRVVQSAHWDPPPVPTDASTHSAALVPTAFHVLPLPPPYRARHRRFVQALTILATPFRLLAAHSDDVNE